MTGVLDQLEGTFGDVKEEPGEEEGETKKRKDREQVILNILRCYICGRPSPDGKPHHKCPGILASVRRHVEGWKPSEEKKKTLRILSRPANTEESEVRQGWICESIDPSGIDVDSESRVRISPPSSKQTEASTDPIKANVAEGGEEAEGEENTDVGAMPREATPAHK